MDKGRMSGHLLRYARFVVVWIIWAVMHYVGFWIIVVITRSANRG